MNEDLRSSVFGKFLRTKIFGLQYSEIFHERRYSVSGLWKFFKNEDLRSSVFGQFHSSVQLWDTRPPGAHEVTVAEVTDDTEQQLGRQGGEVMVILYI